MKLRRTAGAVVQGCDVYIGRRVQQGGWNLAASKWANPFRKAPGQPAGSTLQAYAYHLASSPHLLKALPELQGKVLGCWCAPETCHGRVLQEFELLSRHDWDPFVLSGSLFDQEFDAEESPKIQVSDKPQVVVPEGHLEATIIGLTHMRARNVGAMAILQDGTLFRPLPLDCHLTTAHPLAKLYTRFEFTATSPPAGTMPPHQLDDVGLANVRALGNAAHVDVLAAFDARAQSSYLVNQDKALLRALSNKQFLLAGDVLHSTCVAVPESDVTFYSEKVYGRLRASLTLGGVERSFPVVSVALVSRFAREASKPFTIGKECIRFIRIGLARPWLPEHAQFQQPRCYAMLVGMVCDDVLL